MSWRRSARVAGLAFRGIVLTPTSLPASLLLRPTWLAIRYHSIPMTSGSKPTEEGGRAAVRLATAADIPQLFDVRTSVRENHLDMRQLAERGVTPESMAEQIASDESRTWVIEHDGRIAGFSMADALTGSIVAIFVAPGMEGRGHGRALLDTAEEWLFTRGWEAIRLQTGSEPYNRSHGFYRRAGWVMMGPADHGDVRYEKSRRGSSC